MDGNNSSTSSKIGQDQPLAVLSDVVFSGKLLPIPVAKQSINPDDLKDWADQMEMELIVPSPVPGAADSSAWENVNGCQKFSGWMASNLVSGATFKIKMALLGSLFQLLPGCIGLKSVSRDAVKLFCVEFASQKSLNGATKVVISEEVFLTTFKIAWSSGVVSVFSSFLSVALCNVSLSTSSNDIKSALGIFGVVTSVKLKPAGLWQYVVINFKDTSSAAAAFSNWSVLVRKDSVRILPIANQKEVIFSRDAFKAKLVNLPFGCTAFEISNLVSQVGGHTSATLVVPLSAAVANMDLDFSGPSKTTTSVLSTVFSTSNSAKRMTCLKKKCEWAYLEDVSEEDKDMDNDDNDIENFLVYDNIFDIMMHLWEDQSSSIKSTPTTPSKSGRIKKHQNKPFRISESAFNFYINKKIAYLLGTSVNIESVRETFYNKLIQNTSLLTNHNFASIITEINKEIKHHTQQRYLITYTSKGKKKLQTPAKKTKVESPNNPSYHYTPGSAINISSIDMFALNATSTLRRFPFQSKQKKEDLLRPYKERQEVEKKKESEDHKFTYQNPILENPEIINQYLPPVIVINQPPVEPIGQPIQPQNQQQLPPVLLQQQQQLPSPQQQQMAYALIAKLDKFNGKEDDVQVWLNDVAKAIIANNWNDARAIDFEAAELEANHTQAVNLAMNRSSELDSKLKQFSDSINQKLEGYLADNRMIYQPSQWRNNQRNANRFQNQSHPSSSFNQSWIITTDEATKTLIGEIDDFSIEVNGIIVPIKVLVMEATQYQVLVGNDWLFKTNAVLNWTTQELVLSQNGQHTRVPATCGHFKAINTTAPLIDFKEKKPKPTWEVYQVSWADEKHNKLLPILLWDNNSKEKQKRTEPIWNIDQAWNTDHNLKEPPIWRWDKKKKGKEKVKEEEPLSTVSYTPYTYTPPQLLSYHQPKLICIDCGKKLLSIGTCCGNNKKYQMATKFYRHTCLVECFGRPK
ncbi:hypothetical protein G9A89_005041 [Geosiphon pyriformis]|nr:hypothetical protein G9A89_005041 [Geosiphon pyriformis]